MQVFNIFNARELGMNVWIFDGLLSRSYMLCGVTLVIACFQLFAVEVAGSFMQTTHLNWKYWLICIAFGFAEIPFGVLVRLVPMKNEVPEEVRSKWAREAQMRAELGMPLDTTPRQRKIFVSKEELPLHHLQVRKS